MADEFYGYVERQAGSQINWAKIGSDITKTLQDEQKFREQKKAEIDEATQKTLDELTKAPRGTAEDGNKFTLDYANDATQSLLLANRLLKSGKMSVKDYSLLKANVDSGTGQLFNLQKEYQKWYEIKKQRMYSNDPKNKSQSIEGDAQGHMEAFGDFSKSRAVIDPMTGRVNVGIMKDMGNGTSELSKDVMSVQDLYKSLGHTYDYFPSADVSTTIAAKLAPVIMTQIKAGSINEKGQTITYEDPLQREAIKNKFISESNTQKAMNDAIESFMNIPTNVTSILTDDIGTYNNVFSEEERAKDPENNILWRVDKYGTFAPDLTDKQKKAAHDYMKLQVESMVKQKVETDLFEPQALQREELRIRQQNANTAAVNASKSASGGGSDDDGTGWYNYVATRVPDIPITANADEALIEQLTANFIGMDMDFVQEKGTKRESIIVQDRAFDPPQEYKIVIQGNPNWRQNIIDLIRTIKSGKGKDMISTGVIKKKANDNPSSNTGTKSNDPLGLR